MSRARPRGASGPGVVVMGPVLSIVVPAYNEEALLPALLDSIRDSVDRLGAPAGAIEVVVADNGSTDRTAAVAREGGARVVAVPERGIASARNAGAAAAEAGLLAFVDADSRLAPECIRAVLIALQEPGRVGGATGVTVDRWSIPLRLLALLTLPARLLGIDAGVVFCRRDDFVAVGGYRTQLLVGEDIDFLWRLRRHGRRTGRALVRLRGVETTTSTRKFDRHGHWRFFGVMLRLGLLRVASAAGFERDARRYWYEDR